MWQKSDSRYHVENVRHRRAMTQRKYRVIDIPPAIVSDIVGATILLFFKDLLNTQNLILRWYGVFRSNVLRDL